LAPQVHHTAAAAAAAATAAQVNGEQHTVENDSFLRVIYDFSRPHTLIGSALSIPAIAIFATGLPASLPAARQLTALVLAAMVPSLLINIHITGLNQITDVEIDRVNKPELPIAAGRLSMRAAIATVTACLVGGVGLGYLMPAALTSHALQGVIVGSTLLGGMYSLPPIRLKRFPLLAAMCILSVRGAVMNACFYAHFALKSGALSGALSGGLSPPSLTSGIRDVCLLPLRDARCGLLVGFFAVFGVVIALLKDVPDFKGDAQHNIRSFTVRMGRERVFAAASNLMIALLWGTGAAMAAAAVRAASAAGTPLSWVVGARAALAAVAGAAGRTVLLKRRAVNPTDPKQVYKFYMFLWGLFYTSYLCLPFVR
ncbi:tocopherol phytyltransferase, partial [Tribonema minus]